MTEQEVRYAILQAQEKAEKGDVISQHFLGISYLGLKDYGMAAKWFEKAAEQGYADAQMRLGLQLYNGQGVIEDKAKGIEWIKKAAEQGYARAQFHIGNFTEDNLKSAEWYEKAAEQGDADAQYELGLLYFNGKGVPKDNIKAGQWFKKSGDQGNEKSKEFLSKVIADALFDQPEIQNQRNAAAHKFYMEGNHKKAAELYVEMADRGNAVAQYKLGLLYSLGQGVINDSIKSNELISKAATQGLKEAKDWLEKEELERKEREEKECKEREHQEWLKTEDGQKWQAEQYRLKEKKRKKEETQKLLWKIGRIAALLLTVFSIIMIFVINGISEQVDNSVVISLLLFMIIPFTVIYFCEGIIKRIIFFIVGVGFAILILSIFNNFPDYAETPFLNIMCISYIISCVLAIINVKDKY
ncbi:MAG: SEL1-like repeat protein [Treponema sp.]|nr:SEL1-like repeat protein [Treponema sp.]